MAGEDEVRIRRRAYEIWEEQGRPEGRDQDHWKQARQEVEEEGQSQADMEMPDATIESPETSRSPEGHKASEAEEAVEAMEEVSGRKREALSRI